MINVLKDKTDEKLLYIAFYSLLHEIHHTKPKEMPFRTAKPYLDNIMRYSKIYNVDPIYVLSRSIDYYAFTKRKLKHTPILSLSVFDDKFLTKSVASGLNYSHKVANDKYLINDLHHNILLRSLSDLYRLLNNYPYEDILKIYQDYKRNLYNDYYEHEYLDTTIEKLHNKAISNNTNWVDVLLLIEGASRLRPLIFLLDDDFNKAFLNHCNSNEYLIYYYGLRELSNNDIQETYDYKRETYLSRARKVIKGD